MKDINVLKQNGMAHSALDDVRRQVAEIQGAPVAEGEPGPGSQEGADVEDIGELENNEIVIDEENE